VQKRYLALVPGAFTKRIDHNAPIMRIGPGALHGVQKGGKPASTVFLPTQQGEWASLVEARPRTGRTHQIRVHLADLGFPILGDPLYDGVRYTAGNSPQPILRCMLHAHTLAFNHPHTGERVSYTAPPAADFAALAGTLGLRALDLRTLDSTHVAAAD